MKSIFTPAYAYAEAIHAKDFRKDGKTPYMVHIDAVVAGTERLVLALYPDIMSRELDSIKAVAALHDGPEDHRHITWNDVYNVLSDPEDFDYNAQLNMVIGAIKAITKKPKGEEEYVDYVRRVNDHHWAQLVKIADLDHNMSDLGPGSLRDKYSLTRWVLVHELGKYARTDAARAVLANTFKP